MIERVWFAIVMKYFGKRLARNSQHVRHIVVTGGYDDLAGAVVVNFAGAIGSRYVEVFVFPCDGFDPLVLADLQSVMLGNFTVVLERFLACGFLVRSAERNSADLQQCRRGEER